MRPIEVRIAIVVDNFSPHVVLRLVAHRIEAQFTALRHFALDGTDHGSHRQQASMISRYLVWRNTHRTDPLLRKVVRRAETIKRARVA